MMDGVLQGAASRPLESGTDRDVARGFVARLNRSATLKRLIDVVAATAGLIVLSPLLLAVAVAIRLRLGAPVLFRQPRAGLHHRPFTLVKFRTMRDLTDRDGSPLPDEERMTSLGRFLRDFSLDELPQLWNVLRGDMSLVGPRPLLLEYRPLYSPEQARRHDVRPGITGWAQVSGRNTLSWPEKFALDTWYVTHRTLWLDLRILFMTFKIVAVRAGIRHEGHATAPKFRGNHH